MGGGVGQVVIILVAAVIGLPLFFFALLAALDRFERSLSEQPRTVAPPIPAVVATTSPEPTPETDADVLPLPKAASSAPASSPASARAATG